MDLAMRRPVLRGSGHKWGDQSVGEDMQIVVGWGKNDILNVHEPALITVWTGTWRMTVARFH